MGVLVLKGILATVSLACIVGVAVSLYQIFRLERELKEMDDE